MEKDKDEERKAGRREKDKDEEKMTGRKEE